MLRSFEGRGDVIFRRRQHINDDGIAKLSSVRHIHFRDVFFKCKYPEYVHSKVNNSMLALLRFDSTIKHSMPALLFCLLYVYPLVCFQYGKLSIFANTQPLSNNYSLSSIAHCLFLIVLMASTILHASTLKSGLSYRNQPRLDIFMGTINLPLYKADLVRVAHKLVPREDFCDTYLDINLPKLKVECPDAFSENSFCAFVALGIVIQLVDISLVSGNQILKFPPVDSSDSSAFLVESFALDNLCVRRRSSGTCLVTVQELLQLQRLTWSR